MVLGITGVSQKHLLHLTIVITTCFFSLSSICKWITPRFISIDSVNAHPYITLKFTMSDEKQSTEQEHGKANSSD